MSNAIVVYKRICLLVWVLLSIVSPKCHRIFVFGLNECYGELTMKRSKNRSWKQSKKWGKIVGMKTETINTTIDCMRICVYTHRGSTTTHSVHSAYNAYTHRSKEPKTLFLLKWPQSKTWNIFKSDVYIFYNAN